MISASLLNGRTARRLAIAAAVAVTAVSLAAHRAGSSPGPGYIAPGNTVVDDGSGATAVSGPMTHPDQDHAGWSLRPVAATQYAIAATVTQTRGMDVSGWQGNVNWSRAWSNGARFAFVKATEGTSYRNPYFAQQYNGSYNVGMIRGAYHFALPDRSSGTAQADYFVSHGGGWSRDGKTLPPALDIEYNPYGARCYGYSAAGMVSWIRAFSNEVHRRTGRYPVIYSTRDWWVTCTGNSAGFATANPLWIARYSSGPGTLPAGWSFYTFWQYASSGIFPGDQDYFNGSLTRLRVLATG
jgi:GH25 family lysozyme M1 (1,4-beta-N-acetylmuramidase)